MESSVRPLLIIIFTLTKSWSDGIITSTSGSVLPVSEPRSQSLTAICGKFGEVYCHSPEHDFERFCGPTSLDYTILG